MSTLERRKILREYVNACVRDGVVRFGAPLDMIKQAGAAFATDIGAVVSEIAGELVERGVVFGTAIVEQKISQGAKAVVDGFGTVARDFVTDLSNHIKSRRR